MQTAPAPPPPPVFVLVPGPSSSASPFFGGFPANNGTGFPVAATASPTNTTNPASAAPALSARGETGGGDPGSPNTEAGLALTKPSGLGGPSVNTLHLPLASLLTPADRRKTSDDRVILGGGDEDEDTSERDALFTTLLGGELVREKDLFGQLFITEAPAEEKSVRFDAPVDDTTSSSTTVLWFVLTAVATEASIVFRTK